ncbi:MAG TPA: hypothetical protein VG271_11290, partial [Beijerinckiaceae bacterium]|nr:hypothetical protein [Beijerinckiaceae bacterium]
KTDGVPLFVEELTKTVLESGLVRETDGSYVLASALTPLAIPSTLQDSLMARLDRLASVREVAQIGAAIGREFSWRLLEAVAPVQGSALQKALDQLMASEMVYGHGVPPDATYVFKHALVQDTAYGSLLRGRRQRIHADIARALTEGFADGNESVPAIVAHHYTEAGLPEPAVRAWLAAAELALSRSAYAEADRHIETGLVLIPNLPDGPDRQAIELALQLARANALTPLKGYTAPETAAALTAAKHLLDAGVGIDLQRFFVLYGLCEANYFAARLEEAFGLAQQIVEVADRQDDTTCWLVGYRLLGTMQVLTGQHRQALESLRQAEQYRDPGRQKALSYRFATDPGLAVLCYDIQASLFLGLFDRASRVSDAVRAELPSHGHATTVATCTFFALVWPELLQGDLEACERDSAELVAYCTEKRVEHWRLFSAICHACARAGREPTAENIAAFRAAIDAEHQTGACISDSIFIGHLAQALLASGDLSGAESVLQQGFAFVERSGELYWLAEMHRLDGLIELGRPAPDRTRAQACFLLAIEIARQQAARLLELRAATDLAKLWREAGWPHDPRPLLEPILAAIEGSKTTRDIGTARALLAELV